MLRGYPLYLYNENKRPMKEGDSSGSRISNVKVGCLKYVDENMSLKALGMGIAIIMRGVVVVFILWNDTCVGLIPL
jgi:hypothetical protein